MNDRPRPLGTLLLAASLLSCGKGVHNDQSTETSTGATTATSATAADTSTVSATSTSSASTSSSTDTATDASSSTTDGCGFVCPVDVLEEFACDNFAQDCPEGYKCAAYDQDGNGAWDSTKCVPITGDGMHGDVCLAEHGATGIDTCAEGVMCWNVNEQGVGTCIALCTGSIEDPVCEPPNTSCVIGRGALNLCIPGCSPLAQDCQQGEACIADPMGQGFTCVLDASGGMAPEGTPCEYANVCNPGLFCASPLFYPAPACDGQLGCCAPFCSLFDPDACDGLVVPDAECVPWYEDGMAPPMLEHVGGCGVTP